MTTATQYPMRQTFIVRVGGERYGSIQHVPEYRTEDATKALADAYLADVAASFAVNSPALKIDMVDAVEPDAYLRGQDYIDAYDR